MSQSDHSAPAEPRQGRALHDATRPFAVESRAYSWFVVVSTLTVLGSAITAGVVLTETWARLLASVLIGLTLVRTFIMFHDHAHGAILRNSRIASVGFRLFGLFMMTPSRFWRSEHNQHHAAVGKPATSSRHRNLPLRVSDVGTFPLMTTEQWRDATFIQRLEYRVTRHPLTMAAAALTVFVWSMCLSPLLRDWRRNTDCALALVVHAAIIVGVALAAGPMTALFVVVLPYALAAALGCYLFFVQHNFPGMTLTPPDDWSFVDAAHGSSGYLKLGPVARWFTGNIGYHHLHHLNSRIPFYRLPAAMAAIPEMQSVPVTTVGIRDIVACLRLNLWDPAAGKLVPFGAAGRAPA
jgi:omega-6 fatty acid desaturase (delta-12 desaturase)